MPKPFSKYWYYLTHSWEDKGVHTFPKGICPKVNVIVRLVFELADYDSAVHRFNHYTARTPSKKGAEKAFLITKNIMKNLFCTCNLVPNLRYAKWHIV